MNFFKLRERTALINSWLLVAICFVLPTKVSFVYTLTFFMLILWLIQPGLVTRWQAIVRAKINWGFVAYYGIFLISLLWTTDMKWGWHMVGRQIPFLLFPLFWSVAKGSDQRRCISAFIAAVAISVMLAYYNWLRLHIFLDWPAGIQVNKSVGDTAPFVDRIMYAPILAFGAYFVGYRILFEHRHVLWQGVYILVFLSIVVNLLLSGGRAGMVGFAILLVTLIIQYFSRRPIRALVCGLLITGVIFGAGYSISDHFKKRVDSAISEAKNPAVNINTSVGLRINFIKNTAHIVLENPLIGVGAGDFPAEYKAINDRFTPQAVSTVNPHNQIMLVLATTGLLGGVILLFLIFATFGSMSKLKTDSKHFITALWIGYGAICLFESYLWRSNTALMFCVLMAIATSSVKAVSDIRSAYVSK
jgi:O-antigen ligase